MLQLKITYYYRFNERTGDRLRYAISEPIGMNNINRDRFKKNGEPRDSILIKSKRFYREN